MFKVSIIIPIFKVEQYIECCVCSVLNQTYRELEIILIDDCSPDHSLGLAKQIIEKSEGSKDLEVLYLKHEINRGLSAARNTGLKVASGDYVFFLDSDDYISSDCIDVLVSLAQKYPNVDIVQGNYKVVGSGYEFLDISKTAHPEYSNDSDWIKRNFLGKGVYKSALIPTTAHNKLFNKSFLLDNELWYKEGIYFEDEYWRLQNWSYVKSIAISNNYTYYYRIRESSIIRAKDNINKKWESELIILKDYLLSPKTVNTKDIKYGIISLLWKYGIYKDRLNRKFQNNLFNKYLCEIKNNRNWCSLYAFALGYLQLPMFFVRMKLLKLLLLLHCNRSSKSDTFFES